MTRIIAGALAGRRLEVPAAGARPTTDRVREAVFSTLTHRIGRWETVRCADLFAGSGALGLEALSRGARSAVFVERDRAAVAVLRRNAAALGASDRCEVVRADAERWSPRPGTRIDLLFADPPYLTPATAVAAALLRLAALGALAPGAHVVVERPRRDALSPLPGHWADQEQRRYGETCVWYGRAQDDPVDVEGT